ncbi:MAG: LacI family transcriptional regulator [Verrucomicrobia bacterium]|nr:LacI family transcriptional regulator [Verrucomicrobiota bacterium]
MERIGKVSMREIARTAGVSVSAVSLALRNQSRVSLKERRRIQAIARKLGYKRDPEIARLMEHLRTTRAQRPGSQLAVIIPELDREGLAGYSPITEMLKGIRAQAEEAGFGTELFFLTDPGMTPARLRNILVARGIKGLIVAPYASGVGTLDMDMTGFCAATAGYSIVRPLLHRACPNYLQMMDELIDHLQRLHFHRIGFIHTYGPGGIGHKLLASSYLYYQSLLTPEERIPILPRARITDEEIAAWLNAHRPEVVISSGRVFNLIQGMGRAIPGDLYFANLDLSEPPRQAAGMDHRYQLVGSEAVKLVLTQFTLNLTGPPENPKVVLVDSHRRDGFTLPTQPLDLSTAVPARKKRFVRAEGS